MNNPANTNSENTFSFSDPIPNMKSEVCFNTDIETPKIKVDLKDKPKNIFDPILFNLKVIIPRKIEKILKNMDRISFIYEINDNDMIEVIDMMKKVSILHIPTYDFDSFPFKDEIADENSIIFIFNKDKVKNDLKIKQSKKFKESITKNIKFENIDLFKDMRSKYIDFQIKNKVNFVFVENSEMLHSQIKSMLSLKNENRKFAPKTKKFLENEKNEFLQNILENIPGISKSVSKAILDKYYDIDILEEALENKDNFMSIEIVDENGATRLFPEKLYKKLFNTFKSTDPSEKI